MISIYLEGAFSGTIPLAFLPTRDEVVVNFQVKVPSFFAEFDPFRDWLVFILNKYGWRKNYLPFKKAK